MRGSELPPQDSGLLRGPPVARWRCPCCGESVARILPNGVLNRHRLDAAQCVLPHPAVEARVAALGGVAPTDACLSCRDAVRQLVGTLIRPPGEEGEARGGPGLNDTGIVGAVLPGGDGGMRVLIFHVINGRLAHTETETLRELEVLRLTYPGSRGAVAPLIWELYETHLAQLHKAAE